MSMCNFLQDDSDDSAESDDVGNDSDAEKLSAPDSSDEEKSENANTNGLQKLTIVPKENDEDKIDAVKPKRKRKKNKKTTNNDGPKSENTKDIEDTEGKIKGKSQI